MCIAVLAQPPPMVEVPPLPEPFMEPGGVHLIVSHTIHGLLMGPGIWFSAKANTSTNVEVFMGPAIAVPIVNLLGSFAAAVWLKPSPLVAYESAVLGWAGFFAGLAFGDFYISQRQTQGSFNMNLAWPVRLIGGAVGQLIGALVPLLPGRRDPPWWQFVATLGAVALGTAILIGISSTSRGFAGPSLFGGDVSQSIALFVPFVLGAATNVALRYAFPETGFQVAPQPLPEGGLGVSLFRNF